MSINASFRLIGEETRNIPFLASKLCLFQEQKILNGTIESLKDNRTTVQYLKRHFKLISKKFRCNPDGKNLIYKSDYWI